MQQAGAPSYARQAEAACWYLSGVAGGVLVPQAVAPAASCHYPSGTAVCQHVSQPTSTQQHASACPLPEIQQLAAQCPQQRSLEAHVILPRSLQDNTSPQEQGSLGRLPPSTGPSSHEDQTQRDSTQHHGCYTPSSWMHPDLQLYLHELEQSQWTASAAAAAASAVSSSTAEQLQAPPSPATAEDGSSSVDLKGAEQQHRAAHDPLLSWLMAVHPWADAGCGSTPTAQQQSSTTTLSTTHERHATDEHQSSHSIQHATQDQEQHQHQHQQQTQLPGLLRVPCSVHPNMQPVLQIVPAADDSSSNISSSTPGGGGDSSRPRSACLLTSHISTDAAAVLRFCPATLGGDWHLRFLLHQLLHAVADLHARGLAMGGFTLDQLRLICPAWLQLVARPAGQLLPLQSSQPQHQHQRQHQQGQVGPRALSSAAAQAQWQWMQGSMVVSEPYYTLPQLTDLWRRRCISNLEYLLWVNAAAGRRWGDRKRHPFVPWVLDFSTRPAFHPFEGGMSTGGGSSNSPPAGWRDLGVSQYRRIKGDAQLDQTYAMSVAAAAAAGAGPQGPWSGCVAGTAAAAAAALALGPATWEPWEGGEGTSSGGGSSSSIGVKAVGPAGNDAAASAAPAVQPHHISNEPMSELSYAIYMARRLPVELLVQLVRRSFRPEEYPSSLEGLYHSSPDEALPQFYCDPQAFASTHASMQDLAVPGWAKDTADFVRIHRAALESEYVSATLHKWLDLNFGVALSGPAGLANKNIHLGSTDSSSSTTTAGGGTGADHKAALGTAAGTSGMVVPGLEPCTRGVYQLFQLPHPARSSGSGLLAAASSGPEISHNTGLSSSSALALDAPKGSGQPQQDSHSSEAAGPDSDDDDSSSSRSSSRSTSAGTALEACWVELSSLEAAAAAGAWNPSGMQPGAAAAAAGPSSTTHSRQQLTQPSSRQQQQLEALLANATNVQYAGDSAAGSMVPMVLLPAEAAAADLAAVGQVALQLYSKQQQEIALGASAGHFAAQQCWQFCRSCSNSSRSWSAAGGPGSSTVSGPYTGSRQTGAALQSGCQQPQVPPSVSLFAQECGSGSYTADELIKVSSFLPSWLQDARQFMLQLLFKPAAPDSSQQQQAPPLLPSSPQQHHHQDRHMQKQHGSHLLPSQQRGQAAAAPAGSCCAAAVTEGGGAGQAWWQLTDDAFDQLALLAAPGGALDQLAQGAPEALQVCLPAILHVVRGRLLHGLPAQVQRPSQQPSAPAAAGQPETDQQQRALLLLDSTCLVLFRLATVLSRLQVQQHLVPLLSALLSADAGDFQAAFGAPQQLHTPHAASAKAGINPAGNKGMSSQEKADAAAAAGGAGAELLHMPAAVRAAVGRRAALQPALWQLLTQKLQQEQVLATLLPPLLAVLLDSQTAGQAHHTAAPQHNQQQQQHLQDQLKQQSATQAELACSCLVVLAESLPFPVVAQHVLRPLMLALPAAFAASSGSKTSTYQNARHASSAAAQHAAAAVATFPAFNAACGLLAVARVLPQQLVEEFVFRPVLQLALLPLHKTGPAVDGGSDKTLNDVGGASTAASAGHLTLGALPVLEGLLLPLLPVLVSEVVLPSLPPAASAGAAAGSPSTSAAGTVATTSTSASNTAGGSDSGAAGLAPAASLSRNSSMQHQTYAAAAGSPGQPPGGPGQLGAGSARANAAEPAALWQLSQLLLAPDMQAVAACPLVYPRIAALLVLGIECFILQGGHSAGGSGSGSRGGSSSGSTAASKSSSAGAAAAAGVGADAPRNAREQLTALYSGWLVPAVLQPLVGLPVMSSWGTPLLQQAQQQQQQQQLATKTFWRTVLLLYAAAVHQLGLSAVRAALPDWHSVEVWLLAETGWEPDLAAAAAATPDAPASASPTLQLLTCLALQGSCSQTAAAANSSGRNSTTTTTNGRNSSSNSITALTPEVLQQTGFLAGLQPAAAQEAALGNAAVGCGTNGRAAAGLQHLLAQGGSHTASGNNSGGNSSSNSQIAGRVTHLLQRIAEEKVVRRSLNTTHEFMEGVGWSLPRPTTPTGGGAAAAAAAVTSSGGGVGPALLDGTPHEQQQVSPGEASNAATDRGSAQAGASGGSSSGSGQVQYPLPNRSSMPRAASAPSSAAVGARSSLPQPTTAAGRTTSPRPVKASAAGHSGNSLDATGAEVSSASAPVLGDVQQQQQLAATAAGANSWQRQQQLAAGAAAGQAITQHGAPPAAGVQGGVGGSSWAAELSQLRSLLETPTRTSAADRGPSVGKEWFWLRGNAKLDPSHLLPDFSHFPAANNGTAPAFYSSWQAVGSSSSSSRPWDAAGGMWWEEGWKLGAVCLHSWPAHRERLRALAVDPGERLLVTAGRGGTREAGTSSSSWVVRVWELADAEAKVQYGAHTAAVHQVAFLGPCSSAVASLDVSGGIHVWSRATGAQLHTFVPLDPADVVGGASTGSSWAAPGLPRSSQQQTYAPSSSTGNSSGNSSSYRSPDDPGLGGPPPPPPAAATPAGGPPRSARELPSGGTTTVAQDSRVRGSSSVPAAAAVLGSGMSTGSASDAVAAAAAAGVSGGMSMAPGAGGYWERGCSSGRGWQALAALPTSQQLAAAGSTTAASGSAAGSSISPPSSGPASGGVLDAAGAAALSGPGWPLTGCHLGYTCMVPVDSNNAMVQASMFGGSNAGDGGSSSSSSTAGLLLAGTADGHVCLLDVETGALLEDCIACWDPRPRLYSSSLTKSSPQQQQLLMQQQVQANSLLSAAAAGGPGVLGPAGWDGFSAAADPSNFVLSAVCYSSRGGYGAGAGALGGWVGAGSGGGRITLLDMRAGMVIANWQAHSQRVSQLQGLASTCGEHLLLSCSCDKMMKLWDLRMIHQTAASYGSSSRSSGSSMSGLGSSALATPVTTFKSGRDGIEGFVVYQDAAIVYGGTSLGLAPLDLSNQVVAPGGAAAAGWPGSFLAGQLQHQQQQQQGGNVQVVRMTAVRGLGHRASGVREGLGAAGTGAVVGLGLLPHSKLLVVGTEDGLMRICR